MPLSSLFSLFDRNNNKSDDKKIDEAMTLSTYSTVLTMTSSSSFQSPFISDLPQQLFRRLDVIMNWPIANERNLFLIGSNLPMLAVACGSFVISRRVMRLAYRPRALPKQPQLINSGGKLTGTSGGTPTSSSSTCGTITEIKVSKGAFVANPLMHTTLAVIIYDLMTHEFVMPSILFPENDSFTSSSSSDWSSSLSVLALNSIKQSLIGCISGIGFVIWNSMVFTRMLLTRRREFSMSLLVVTSLANQWRDLMTIGGGALRGRALIGGFALSNLLASCAGVYLMSLSRDRIYSKLLINKADDDVEGRMLIGWLIKRETERKQKEELLGIDVEQHELSLKQKLAKFALNPLRFSCKFDEKNERRQLLATEDGKHF